MDITKLFIYFIIYSFMGWSLEVISKFFQYKRFINRGFLIGPLCTIYGYGVLAIVLVIGNNTTDILSVFLKTIFICSILEYLTSYFMEKIFNAKWWDYSNRKFNINGRVCLENSIWFGLLGILLIYVVNPFLYNLISKMSDNVLLIVSSFLLIIFVIDLIISLNVTFKIKSNITKLIKKDSTEEFNHKIKELIDSKLLNRRLFKAFPKLKFNIKDKVIDFRNNIKEKIEKK